MTNDTRLRERESSGKRREVGDGEEVGEGEGERRREGGGGGEAGGGEKREKVSEREMRGLGGERNEYSFQRRGGGKGQREGRWREKG